MKTKKKISMTGNTGYQAGDDVFVSDPRSSRDAWGQSFRGTVMAAKGKSVIVSDGTHGWDIPISKVRRPSFACTSQDSSMITELDSFPAAERTDFLCRLTDMVVQRVAPSLIVAGDPGIGKTWNVRDRFDRAGMILGEDYYMVKGRIMGLGLYKLLYQMNGKIILFDDSDSVFEDKNSQNILKAALDSYDERLISWHTSAPEREGLPRCFMFTGAAIFITNKDICKIDSAVADRSFRMNFTMNNSEVLDRIGQILPKMDLKMPLTKEPVPMVVREEVLNCLEDMQDSISKISFRTFIQAIRIRITNPDKWQMMIPLFA
jgi:hypothetical protein